MEILYPAFITVVLMYAWFETDAFEVYSKTFNLGWFGLGGYWSEKEEKPMFDYHTHLLMKFPDSFFVKLVTCPVCLIVWVAPLVSFLYNGAILFHIIFMEIFFAWALFFGLKTLVKISDR
jgi:hypothetical protein